MNTYFLCNTLLVAVDESIAEQQELVLCYALLYDLIINKDYNRFSDSAKWSQNRSGIFTRLQFILESTSTTTEKETDSLQVIIEKTYSKAQFTDPKIPLMMSLMQTFDRSTSDIKTGLYKTIQQQGIYIGELAVFDKKDDDRIYCTLCSFSMQKDDSCLFDVMKNNYTITLFEYSISMQNFLFKKDDVINKVASKKDKIITL